MHIADFALERYFAKWEFAVRHVLCASDVEPIGMSELLAYADDDARERWSSLRLGYTESLGLPALREEIARQYDGVTASDVVVFAGAEEAVFLVMNGLLGRGDHAVVVWPAYQSLFEVARANGADVDFVPLDPADWSLDVARVERAMRENTRAIVINFPHSPTGAQISADQLAALVALAERRGAHLVSDEVYRFLEHGAPRLPAAATLTERGVSIGVMSKTFGLAGVRIGWVATRDHALRAQLAALKDYTTICNSAPSEILALIALRARDRLVARAGTIIARNLAELDLFFEDHAALFEWTRPRAGSVCFPRLREGDVDAFCARLVEQEGVLLLPGSQFSYPGGHFRLGYGRRDMGMGLARLAAFVRSA